MPLDARKLLRRKGGMQHGVGEKSSSCAVYFVRPDITTEMESGPAIASRCAPMKSCLLAKVAASREAVPRESSVATKLASPVFGPSETLPDLMSSRRVRVGFRSSSMTKTLSPFGSVFSW